MLLRPPGSPAKGARPRVGRPCPSGPAARGAGSARGIVRVTEGPTEGASRVRRSHFSQVCFGQDDRPGFPQSLNEGRIVGRTIVRIRGVHPGSGTHIERVVLVLDGKYDAVQRTDQLAV